MTLTFENEQDFDLGFDPEEVAAAVINGVLDQEACPYEAEVELILTDPENILLRLRSIFWRRKREMTVLTRTAVS